MRGKNGKLGRLGSRIIAETLVGLIQHDQSSYWHLGAGNGSWQPKDGIMPDGVEITDMAKMMEAARLL